jgi:FAD-linked sulfhydryl oxidase
MHNHRRYIVLLFISNNLFSSRLCALHNKVNERLKKPDFDCNKLTDEYDCGCGDEPLSTSTIERTSTIGSAPEFDPMDLEVDTSKDKITGAELIKGGR